MGDKTHGEFVSAAEQESVARNQAELADMLSILPVASIAYKLAQLAAGLDDGTSSTIPRKELYEVDFLLAEDRFFAVDVNAVAGFKGVKGAPRVLADFLYRRGVIARERGRPSTRIRCGRW